MKQLMLLVALFALTVGTAPAGKPNILLLIADDMAWTDAGCYGNKDVRTPHIDRLAAEGMRFTSAFTATAMCAPTRQQLYTGVFPVRNGAYPNHSRVKPGTRSLVHHFRDMGYRVGLAGKSHFGPRDSFPFDKADPAYLTKNRKQPFFVVVASNSPHVPWPKPDGYDPDKITIPPYMVDNKETREALCRYYTDVTVFDSEVGNWLQALKKNQLDQDTFVIVTSEQGFQFPGGKWTCWELGLHTQVVVRWPGKVKAGSETDAMIQYVDIVPTLIDAAGGDPSGIDTGRTGAGDGGSGFDGRSFLDVLLGKSNEHNEVVYGVHTTKGIIAGQPYPIRSVRGPRYKYIANLNHKTTFHNTLIHHDKENYWKSWERDAATDERAARLVKRYRQRPAEEFYDLEKDPFEMNNLAANPEFRSRMDAMKKQLSGWMEQQGDKGMETELSYKKPPKRKKKNKS